MRNLEPILRACFIKTLFKKLLPIFCLYFLFIPPAGLRAELPAESNRLEEINLKINRLQQDQLQINKSLTETQNQIASLNTTLNSLQMEIKASDLELENLKTESQNLSEQIKDYSERAESLKEQSSKRLRAFYTLGGGQNLALNYVSTKKASLGKVVNYLTVLRKYELSTLKEIERLLRERNLNIEQLEKKTKELSELRNSRKLKYEEHKSNLLDLDKIQSQYKKQKTEKSKFIAELRSEYLRLETALSSLVDTQDNSRKTIKIDSKGQTIEQAGFPSFELNGLPANFPPPVEGKIVTQFGSEILDDFGQKVKLKGLGFLASENQAVLAIGNAKVSFVGPLGTYGNVVILDHGQRMYSLYSKLAAISVTLGTVVLKGQAIGTIGPVEPSSSYNLYFELRKEGKAIDPKPYI